MRRTTRRWLMRAGALAAGVALGAMGGCLNLQNRLLEARLITDERSVPVPGIDGPWEAIDGVEGDGAAPGLLLIRSDTLAGSDPPSGGHTITLATVDDRDEAALAYFMLTDPALSGAPSQTGDEQVGQAYFGLMLGVMPVVIEPGWDDPRVPARREGVMQGSTTARATPAMDGWFIVERRPLFLGRNSYLAIRPPGTTVGPGQTLEVYELPSPRDAAPDLAEHPDERDERANEERLLGALTAALSEMIERGEEPARYAPSSVVVRPHPRLEAIMRDAGIEEHTRGALEETNAFLHATGR